MSDDDKHDLDADSTHVEESKNLGSTFLEKDSSFLEFSAKTKPKE